MSEVTSAAANKALVSEVMTAVFIRRDPSVVERHFSIAYVQHNPLIPNGREAIPALIAALAPTFKYEPGMIVAEGDLVMIHGRYTGWAPKPMVAVDIFRVVDGKLTEHWDIMQEEVPAAQTVSGNGMFQP
ncbi:nuclear transport factor 2 family protein [Nevskia soli]|uniref:nuclear transport factor 2 family protein n=1 Tax=Nevskia soli TaxID=418856 RepID=UPI0004A71D04|nr:nuclear transport factor 2 family protein [Nevskia soli]